MVELLTMPTRELGFKNSILLLVRVETVVGSKEERGIGFRANNMKRIAKEDSSR